MNFRNLLRLSTLALIVTLVLGSFSYGQTRYLNSTDGDDSYSGENPTNAEFGKGPKRTIEGAFEAFADGTTVIMAAGSYNFDQTGIGGGNDANGYTLPAVAANKSMTFVVETYNSNAVAALNGGPLVLQNGTGTIKFQSKTAGVEKVSFSGASITLTSGTLDVSGITFETTGAMATLNVVGGTIVGTPKYANNTVATVNFTNTDNLTVGDYMPPKVGTLNIDGTANKKVTFNSALELNTTGGMITNTVGTGADAEFKGLVTLRANGANITPKIVNNQTTADWTFSGGIKVITNQNNGQDVYNAGAVVADIVIWNQNAGSIIVTGPVTFEQAPAGTATATGNHTSMIENNGAGGKLHILGGLTSVMYTAPGSGAGVYTANASYTPEVYIRNEANMELGGASVTAITGTFMNAGPLALKGNVESKSNFQNWSSINLGANNLTLSNQFTNTANTLLNNGTITSASIGSGYLVYAIRISGVAGLGQASTGTFSNIRLNVTQTGGPYAALVIGGAAAAISGHVEANSSTPVTLTGPTSVSGSVTNTGSALLTLATIGSVTGNVQTDNGGITFGAGGTWQGNVVINGGTITLGGNTTLMGSYTQAGGGFTFGANTFSVKGNFSRTVGTVTPGTGTLEFSAGGTQTFTGGTNLRVYNFSVNSVGTGVTFLNGSLEVMNNATIISNTNVKLGTYNIRMLGLAALAPGNNTFTNAGQYTAEGGGGVIFESPGVGATVTGYISGNGVNSNIEIRLGNETDFIEVAGGQIVTWSGILTLTRGTIQVPVGAILNPSTLLVIPTIRRNLGDANTALGADGKALSILGTFNNTSQSYHLEYVGSPMTAVENVGPEFVVGATRVINLTVTALGNKVNLPAAGTYPFSGNLFVGQGSDLQAGGVAGTDDLISTGTAVTHTVNGKVTGTANFKLNGTGTITGGTDNTAPGVDDAEVSRILVNSSGVYDINNLKLISTSLTVDAGTANLGMQLWGSPADEGNVQVITVNDGKLLLTKDADLVGNFTLAGGIFDFANQNLNKLAGGTVAATGGAFAATDADAKGYLVFEGAANWNTGTRLVPRVLIKNGIVATLTGASGVSDILTDYDSNGAGSVELNTFALTVAANTWNTKAADYNVAANGGTVIVTGSTTVNFGAAAGLIVPNFTLNNDGKNAAFVDNDGAAGTVPSITVKSVFTATKGALNLNTIDVILTNAAATANLDVLVYNGGTFDATTSNTISATDNANGEFVLNSVTNSDLKVGAEGLVLPNVRVANTGNFVLAAATDKAFTVSKRLVLANTGDFNFLADEKLTLGDGAWVKRMNTLGVFDKAPKFAGKINVEYEAGAGITLGKEIPGTASVTGLYVDAAGTSVNVDKALTVVETLYLNAGTYDLENTATKIYPITMGANSNVIVNNGVLANSANPNVPQTETPLAGGPVTLQYINTVARAISGREYPATDAFVSLLKVNSDLNAAGVALTLNAARSCGDFELETGVLVADPDINTVEFDLNGLTLTVTNTASAKLTRGILTSRKVDVGTGLIVYGTLDSKGAVTSTTNASIINVNILGATTMTLAGSFNQDPYAGALPAALPKATITGVASVANFKGDLVVAENLTITGNYSGGTITASKNVTISGNGTLTGGTNLSFVGTTSASLTVPSGGAQIVNMTINKTDNTDVVTLFGGNLRINAGTITFINGLFVTGSFTLEIRQPNWGGGQAFDRTQVTGTRISHVVGKVAKILLNTANVATSSEPRVEFPVGSYTLYRGATINFPTLFGTLPTVPSGVVTVAHIADVSPTGAVGLPIIDGVADGIDVARYPNFYWTIKSEPSIGPDKPFDLELTAAGFTDYDDINNIRIIRRHGTVTDEENQWLLQGTNTSYDNEVVAGIATAIQRGANAGLRAGGAVFTLGVKSNLVVANPIEKQLMILADGVRTIELKDVFAGNSGTLSFTAQSANAAVATVAISGTKLNITPVAIGDVVVTIVALDANNNDFYAYSFDVNVNTEVVSVDEESLPTEFALYQNFPNPFNPTTNIKFDLPKESNVAVKIYNILGEEVVSLVNRVMQAGRHTVEFNASKLTSGMYIYRIEADNFVQVKKMLLMK